MKSKSLHKKTAGGLLAVMSVTLAGAIMLNDVSRTVHADTILSAAQAASYLDDYNVVWNEQSVDSSESMPVGGGDVGCNVWTENNSLYLYIGKSDAYDENNQFLKLGRLKVDFDGVTTVSAYKQELKLRDGYVKVDLATNKGDISADIWVDVNTSTVNVDITSTSAISVTAEYQTWRHTDVVIEDASKDFVSQNAMNDYIGYQGSVTKYADTTAFKEDSVVFYHQNRDENINDLLIEHQKLEDVKDQIWDPLDNRIFGGIVSSSDLVAGSGITNGTYNTYTYKGYPLVSSEAKTKQSVQVFVHTGLYEELEGWTSAINAKINAYNHDTAKTASRNWWHDYFAKSYIIINPGASKSDTAWQVGRNYNLFRYMLGCNAYGDLPSKFNGGMFTFDAPNKKIGYYDPSKSGYGDPDFRLWGGATQTQQNQRLLYWAMMKSGDFDIMPQQLDTYVKASETAEALSWNYYGHGGSMFTEQVNFNGLPSGNHYTWNRNNHGPWSNWDLGVTGEEYTRYQYNTEIEWAKMMLDLHRYTGQDVTEYIPFVESVLTFFQEHYRAMYRALTGSASGYDENGMLVIYPSASMETYKNIVNPIEVTVGLKSVISELVELAEAEPETYADKIQTARWQDLYNRIADPLIEEYNGLQMIMPGTNPGSLDHYYTGSNHAGEFYELNIEKPQLYALFPFELYGLGTDKETLDIVRNTQYYFEDSGSEDWSKNGYISWHHNAVQAARLGDVANAEYFTVRKLADSETLKFPAFWGPGHDWIPDHNWGASGMIGLQEMLLQCDADGTIRPFAATPDDWTVYYKLHAYDDTVVEGSKHGDNVEVKVTVGDNSTRTSVNVNVVNGFENVAVSENGMTKQIDKIKDVNKEDGNLISFSVAKGKTYEITGIKCKAAFGGTDSFNYDFQNADSAEALKDEVRDGKDATAEENGGTVTYSANGVTLSNGAYLTIPASAETNWWNDVTYRLSFKVDELPASETKILNLNPEGVDVNVWLSVDQNGKLKFSYAGTVQETENGYVTVGGEYNVRFTYGTDFYMLTVNGNVIKTFRTGRASPLPMLTAATLSSGTGSITFKGFSASRISQSEVSEEGVSFVKVVDAPSDKIITATNKAGNEIKTLEHVKGPSEIRLSSELTTATDSTGGIRFDNGILRNNSGSISVYNPVYGTKVKDFALEVDVYITAYPSNGKRMTIFNWSNNGWPTNGISMYLYDDGVLKIVNDYSDYSTGVKVPLNRWVKIGFTYSETQGTYQISFDGAPVYISRSVFAENMTSAMKTTEYITFGSRYTSKDGDYPFVGRMRNIGVYLDKEVANEYTKYFDFPFVSSGDSINKTDNVEVTGDIYEAKNAPVQNGADRGLYFGGNDSKIVLDTATFSSLAANQKIPDTFEVKMQIYVPAYGDNMTLFFWAGNDYEESGNGVNGMGMYLTEDGKVRVSFRKVTDVSADTVPLNTWTDIRLVYTGAGSGETDYFKLYIGQTEQTNMHFDAVGSVSSNFWRYAPQLGRTWSGNRAFVGFIDDFSFKADELTVVESLSSIADGKTGSATVTGDVYEAANRPSEDDSLPTEGLYFNGEDSQITLDNPLSTTMPGSFTYEVSIYMTAYPPKNSSGNDTDMAIFWWAAPNSTYPVKGVSLFVHGNGALRIYHNEWECEGSGTTSEGTVPLNDWIKIKLEYTGTGFKLYLNDSAAPTLTTDYALNSGYINNWLTNAPVIGRAVDDSDKKLFKGYLKDIKLTVDANEISLGNTVEMLGNNATSTGVVNANSLQTGGVNDGLYFGGQNGLVQVERVNGTNLPENVVIEVAVYVEDYGSKDMAILHWGTPDKNTWDFNGILLAITNEGKFKLGKHGDAVEKGKLEKNTWTTVKLVYSKANGKVSVYVNGASEAVCEVSVSESDVADLTAYDPVLGGTTASSDKKFFKGYMKDFSMTAKTLPETTLSMDRIITSGGAENDTAGNATATVTGVEEDATVGGYKFDGNTSKVEISNPEYKKNNGFAIELSAYIEAYDEDGDMALVFWGGTNTYPVDGFMLAITNEGKFKLAYQWEEAYTAAGTMPLNKWTTIRLVYVGGNTDYFELYVNGEQVALEGVKADREDMHDNMQSDSIVIGRTTKDDDAKAFVGNMKDVRFYHGVSLKDVTDNYYE